jgi:hypothetical protein
MRENYFNTFTTSLTAGINSSVTTIATANAAPYDGGFRILVGAELMLVTAGGTSTSWTVTRSIEGSSAVSHSSGDLIYALITAGSLNQMRSDMSQQGTYADFLALTGTPLDGDRFKQTDGPYEWIYSGANSSWTPFLLGRTTCVDPMDPILGQTTTLGAAITSTSSTSITVAANFGAMPSTPFRILIGTEQLSVTGTSGTTWTVARGDGGTTAATASNGATVSQMNWFQMKWFSGCWYYDPGNGTHLVNCASAGNQEWGYGVYKPLPNAGTGYTVTFAVTAYTGVPDANYVSYGAAPMDITNQAWLFNYLQFNNGLANVNWGQSGWNGSGFAAGVSGGTPSISPAAINTSYGTWASFHPYTPWYVRFKDDGTNIIEYASPDGWTFFEVYYSPRTSYMTTPSHFGVFASGRNYGITLQILGYRATVP